MRVAGQSLRHLISSRRKPFPPHHLGPFAVAENLEGAVAVLTANEGVSNAGHDGLKWLTRQDWRP